MIQITNNALSQRTGLAQCSFVCDLSRRDPFGIVARSALFVYL